MRRLEKAIALASFIAAVVMAFSSLLISDKHEIAANNCLVIAQFLTLTATLLGIDYKFSQTFSNGRTNHTSGASQQQPVEPSQI